MSDRYFHKRTMLCSIHLNALLNLLGDLGIYKAYTAINMVHPPEYDGGPKFISIIIVKGENPLRKKLI